MNKELAILMNEQIQKEFYSAYLYLSMSVYLEKENLKGFAHWYRVQAQEERDHALIFMYYMQNVGEDIELLAIDKPDNDFASVSDILERTLKHELFVTSLIHNMMSVAVDTKDFAAQSLLQWFVDEQVEEEDNARNNIAQLKLSGMNFLFNMDQQMGTRVYAPSAKITQMAAK
ncbi:MAG: ferritin [Bacillota bacterium]